jgi:hypothetical protein
VIHYAQLINMTAVKAQNDYGTLVEKNPGMNMFSTK